MGLPLPEPAPGEHQVFPEQRMGDAHSNTFGCWANPERNTMLHHYRWEKDASGTTRRRARQPRRPVSIRARQLPSTGETWAPRVEEALAPGVKDLDQLKDHLETEQRLLDVDTLVHIQKAAPHRETPPNLPVMITAASCALAVLLALGMFLHSKLQRAVSCCRRTSETTEGNTPRSPTHPVPDTGNPTANTYAEPRCDCVTFTTYALPCKD